MNQKNKDPMLRALYIILVPIVALIIVLNTGMLQRVVPAASVGGRNYTVARYNFYYFDYYRSFLAENESSLGELGYDPNISDAKQYRKDGKSWKAYFLEQAETNMAETAYYCDLAEAAGYVFSEEELRPVRERLAENADEQTASRISAKNYYTAYYGAGMTEAIFTAELTRFVKGQAYKDYLIRSSAPTQAELDAYIAENSIPDYPALDLRVITLSAKPDRETGEIGAEQITALAQKLDRLAARYGAGESFEDLQAAFSTCALGNSKGILTDATRMDLPEGLRLTSGETPPPSMTYVDGESGTAYFVLFDAVGAAGSGAQREAAIALGEDALLARAAAEIAAQYPVLRHHFGMLLATA